MQPAWLKQNVSTIGILNKFRLLLLLHYYFHLVGEQQANTGRYFTIILYFLLRCYCLPSQLIFSTNSVLREISCQNLLYIPYSSDDFMHLHIKSYHDPKSGPPSQRCFCGFDQWLCSNLENLLESLVPLSLRSLPQLTCNGMQPQCNL